KGNPKDIAMAVSRSALVVICALGIKFVIGALIAEGRGVTLFGPLYGGIASNSTRNLSRLLEILLGASPIALGHILAAVLLYGVPIAILLYTLAWQRDGQRGPKASGRIALFTALVLANLIVVTALFTASVAGSNSTESATRLHMRYYNFALPLLPILAVSY